LFFVNTTRFSLIRPSSGVIVTEAGALLCYYNLEDGRMRLKHVVLTNNNKVKGLVTLMDNKEQILGVNECNRMLKYNITDLLLIHFGSTYTKNK
jgi:hypothetical protein